MEDTNYIKTILTPDEPSMPVMASQYFAISSAAWDNNVMVDMRLMKDKRNQQQPATTEILRKSIFRWFHAEADSVFFVKATMTRRMSL